MADSYSAASGGLSLKDGQVGYPATQDATGKWGPQANQLANDRDGLRNFTNARDINKKDAHGAVEPNSVPATGDVVAFPAQQGLGHSTIFVGSGVVVGAKTEGVSLETVNYEQEQHNGEARVRKWTGTGKTEKQQN